MDKLIEILNEAGFKTTLEGAEAVRAAILQEAGKDQTPLCSGFRVFPNGKKCEGCNDCREP